MSIKNVKRIYNVIQNSLFMTTGNLSYDRLTDAVIMLCEQIQSVDDESEELWYIGGMSHAALGDFIAGAYWHFTEWHDGQYSKSYQALCALGNIFTPSIIFTPSVMVCEDDYDCCGENDTYTLLNDMADSKVYA